MAKTKMPIDHKTGEKIKTPRGTFSLVDMTKEEMKQAEYYYHHDHEGYAIYSSYENSNAFAISIGRA